MTKLEELYQERRTFTKYGLEVPKELAEQIIKEEMEVLDTDLLPVIKNSVPLTIPDCGIEDDVYVIMQYKKCKITKVELSCAFPGALDWSAYDDFNPGTDLVKETKHEPAEYDDNDDDDVSLRSASVGFSVHFADGKVIAEKNAKQTLIETLRYMGLENVSHYTETYAGYPLVGKSKRITSDGYKWQTLVDGWWIYTNLTNLRKIQGIEGAAEMLGISLKVIPNKE